MKIAYLVMNLSPLVSMAPFADTRKIFEDPAKAAAQFKAWGGEDQFSIGLSNRPGVKSFYQCGDVKVELIPLECNDRTAQCEPAGHRSPPPLIRMGARVPRLAKTAPAWTSSLGYAVRTMRVHHRGQSLHAV